MQALDVIEDPLTPAELAARWRAILADPRFAAFLGDVELDSWGRISVSPVNTEHGGIAGNLVLLLRAKLGGKTLVEVGVLVDGAVVAPDVAWCTEAFWQSRREQTPLEQAPTICIEVASPSDNIHDLRKKMRGYIEAGATEAWIVFPKSRRVECYNATGRIERSSYNVDFAGLFD